MFTICLRQLPAPCLARVFYSSLATGFHSHLSHATPILYLTPTVCLVRACSHWNKITFCIAMCCHVGAAGPVFGRLNGLRLRTNRVQTGMHDEEMNTSQTDNKTRPTGLYGTGLCKHVYIKGSFGHDNKTKNEQLHICHRFSSTRGFREVLCSEHETHFFFTLCIFVLTGNRGAIGFLLRSSSSFVQRPRWKRSVLSEMVACVGTCLGAFVHTVLSRSAETQGYNLTAEGAGCKTVTLTDDGYSIESDTPKSTGGAAHGSDVAASRARMLRWR